MAFLYSFVIPHKNNPDLLQRCVDSIPNRDDIQIIVVDDNSDDGKKPNLARENLEIVLLDEKSSKGAGRARNVGLALAKGKWVLFADADDFYKPNFLTVLDIYSQQKIDVLYFNAESANSDTLEPLKRTNIWQSYIKQYVQDGKSLDYIKYGTHFPWNKMVSLQYLRKWNICFEEVEKGNDTFFSDCVGFFSHDVRVERSSLYVYTWTKNSLTTKKINSVQWRLTLSNYFKQRRFLKFIKCEFLQVPLHKFIWRLIKRNGLSSVFTVVSVFFFHFFSMEKQSYKYVHLINKIINNDAIE